MYRDSPLAIHRGESRHIDFITAGFVDSVQEVATVRREHCARPLPGLTYRYRLRSGVKSLIPQCALAHKEKVLTVIRNRSQSALADALSFAAGISGLQMNNR